MNKYIFSFENFKINESFKMYEYQFRDIDNGIYYKREVGSDIWLFTTKEDYDVNLKMNIDNIIEWDITDFIYTMNVGNSPL